MLNALARLLGVSDFLWDDFLRMQYTNLVPGGAGCGCARDRQNPQRSCRLSWKLTLRQVHSGPQMPRIRRPGSKRSMPSRTAKCSASICATSWAIRSEFWDFAAELTDLAEVVVNAVFHLCHEDLRLVYGSPCLERRRRLSQMAWSALGKCGGRELGFASDIELMFIYAGNGQTTGAQCDHHGRIL